MRLKPHNEKAVVCNMYKNEVAAPTIGACYFFVSQQSADL